MMPQHTMQEIDSSGTRWQHTARLMNKTAWLLFILFFPLMLSLRPSTASAGSTPCDCGSCHGDAFHGAGWQGCSGCHNSPPQDGTHLVHYNSAPLNSLRYGGTDVTSTAEAYKFGCGNCHPLNSAKHRDSIVEVELYDASAPAGSLKAKNPPTAAYDRVAKTCSNVYCHSGYTVTSSSVGAPLTSPPNPVPLGYKLNNIYIMDATCSNLTYDPYTVAYARDYKTTPAWGTTFATPRTCAECHAFPLTTYDPEVSAGVGDSHQWVDNNQWNWLHAFNMGFDPIPCRTCHNSTVTEAGATSYGPTGKNGAWITAYGPVPLASRLTHVNGAPDVAFDTVNGFTYTGYRGAHTYSLNDATYNPTAKTCSDVACHYNPTRPGGSPPLVGSVHGGRSSPIGAGPTEGKAGAPPSETFVTAWGV